MYNMYMGLLPHLMIERLIFPLKLPILLGFSPI